MGMTDRFGGIADRARRAVADNADKIGGGLDRAARVADQRTGGKHSDKIHRGVRAAKERLARERDERHRAGDGPPAP